MGNLHGEAQPYMSGVSFNFLFQVKSGCLLEVKMKLSPLAPHPRPIG